MGLGWGQNISNKFPGDADAPGPRTTLRGVGHQCSRHNLPSGQVEGDQVTEAGRLLKSDPGERRWGSETGHSSGTGRRKGAPDTRDDGRGRMQNGTQEERQESEQPEGCKCQEPGWAWGGAEEWHVPLGPAAGFSLL